jgi:hypothetical protein
MVQDDGPVGLDGVQVVFDDRRAVSDAGIVLVVMPQSTTAAPTARAVDRDCSDFDNQAGGPRGA